MSQQDLNQTQGSGQPAASASPTKRLPLVVLPSSRDFTTNKDAQLINCYMEISPSKDIWVFKRPGIAELATIDSGQAGRGLFYWKSAEYSVFGTTLYKDGVSKGTVDGTGGVYQFNSSIGATPRLQLGNGVKAYNYDDTAGLVQITDADFPTSFVKGWGFLDRTTYVMKSDAQIQGSGLSDTINWDPLNTIQAEIEPDDGMALAKQLLNIIALKKRTVEVFYDAGNATGSPLGRVGAAKQSYGCISADTVQDIDGVLVWVARGEDGPPVVVMMENLKIQVVSTRPIERFLEGYNAAFSAYSWQLKWNGHRFYILSLIDAGSDSRTFVFDLTERMWHRWTNSTGDYFPIAAAIWSPTRKQYVLQHVSDGKLYGITIEQYTDAGAAIQADIYTPNYDGGVDKLKYLSKMKFLGDQQPGSVLQVRSSDDDYQNWNEFRQVDLSQKAPVLTDEGSFYRRAYNLRHSSPTPMRLQAVDLHVDLGVL